MGYDALTLEVVKLLIQNQTDAFKSTFVILVQDVKDELKAIKLEISDFKVSLQFTKAQIKEDQKKANSMDTKIELYSKSVNVINDHAGKVESQLEYIENQSR